MSNGLHLVGAPASARHELVGKLVERGITLNVSAVGGLVSRTRTLRLQHVRGASRAFCGSRLPLY